MLFGENGNVIEEALDEVSTEATSMILEAAILATSSDEEIEAFLENTTAVNDLLQREILEERTIVRLDKKAKLNRAIKVAEFQIAKEKNDKNFRKLITIWKMERECEAAIHKKYHTQAVSRAKKASRKGSGTSSNVVNRAAKGLKKELNPEAKIKGSTPSVKPLRVNVPMAKIK